MPWKLILFLLCLVLTTFFVGFNLDNSCNINLGFKTYENVPVFLTVLISFAAGVIIAFLFTLGMRLSSADKKSHQAKIEKKLKAEIKKETVQQSNGEKSSPPASGKPIKKISFFEKRKNMLLTKKTSTNNTPAIDDTQTINLDDDKGVK